MLNLLWENLGQEISKVWSGRQLLPALVYWVAALLAYNFYAGWGAINNILAGIGNVLGLGLLLGILLIVSISVIQALTFPVLRLCEGYWPWPFQHLGAWIVRRTGRTLASKMNRLGRLADQYESGTASPLEAARYANLEAQLEFYTSSGNLRMPTRLGNILRSAEEYPSRCYGLEITTTWPRLRLVLPDGTQQALSEARQALDFNIQLLLWGIALAPWTFLAWWAILPALAVCLAAAIRMDSAALVYARLLCSAYDLHRFALYEALRWPLPASPAEEISAGEVLTVYLKRGLHPAREEFKFTHPKE